MKRIVFIALVISAISLASASVQAQQKFSAVVTDAERWAAIDYEAPSECTGGPEECAIKMLAGASIEVGEDPEFSVYHLGQKVEKNVTVVFVSHFVEDDDSVLGRLYRLELSQGTSNSFQLDKLGAMSQCMNGPAGWRKAPCPE
ncbi:MAG TPA: hypothetical protein VFZ49_07985 [Pyrinomonadaceae bacterium]